MIHVCKNPEMGRGFHFLAHGLEIPISLNNYATGHPELISPDIKVFAANKDSSNRTFS